MTTKKLKHNLVAPIATDISQVKKAPRATSDEGQVTGSAFSAMAVVSTYMKSGTTDDSEIMNRLYEQADVVLQGDMSQVESMCHRPAYRIHSVIGV
jgi:hypothetical protein